MKQQYVCGFLFSEDRKEIALIVKKKPKWQEGKVNGIRGKMEEKDTLKSINHRGVTNCTPITYAMSREFKEETGVDIHPYEWHHYATINGSDYTCNFLRAFGDPWECQTMEEEEIIVINVEALDMYDHIPNLRYLIPMALDKSIHHVTIEEL